MQDSIVSSIQSITTRIGVVFVKKNEDLQSRDLERIVQELKIEVEEHDDCFFSLRSKCFKFLYLIPKINESLVVILSLWRTQLSQIVLSDFSVLVLLEIVLNMRLYVS